MLTWHRVLGPAPANSQVSSAMGFLPTLRSPGQRKLSLQLTSKPQHAIIPCHSRFESLSVVFSGNNFQRLGNFKKIICHLERLEVGTNLSVSGTESLFWNSNEEISWFSVWQRPCYLPLSSARLQLWRLVIMILIMDPLPSLLTGGATDPENYW